MTLISDLKKMVPHTVVAFYRLKQGAHHQYILILKEINEKNLMTLSEMMKEQYLECKTLSEHELAKSLDVFPMEFLDFKYQGELLLGADVIRTMRASKKNLRHECEFYLRSRLLRLREAYAALPRQSGFLISESFPLFLQTFCYLSQMLRLKWNDEDLYGSMRNLGKKIDVDMELLITIHQNLERPDYLDTHFFDYHDALTDIVKFVDVMD